MCMQMILQYPWKWAVCYTEKCNEEEIVYLLFRICSRSDSTCLFIQCGSKG